MKLNESLLKIAAIIVTLSISTISSAQAKEVTNYVRDHSSQSSTQVLVAAADADKQNQSGTSSDQGFISQRTTALEFTFATLVVLGGLIFSDRYQRNQEKQQIASGESNANDLALIEEQLEHQDLTKI